MKESCAVCEKLSKDATNVGGSHWNSKWQRKCRLRLGMSQVQEFRMLQAQGVDRRRWERIPVPVPVFVRGLDSNGSTFQEFTTAINISAGGVAFMLRKRPANDHSSVLVEIPAAPGPLLKDVVRRIEGVLTRVEGILDWYVCGLQFGRPLLPESRSQPKE